MAWACVCRRTKFDLLLGLRVMQAQVYLFSTLGENGSLFNFDAMCWKLHWLLYILLVTAGTSQCWARGQGVKLFLHAAFYNVQALEGLAIGGAFACATSDHQIATCCGWGTPKACNRTLLAHGVCQAARKAAPASWCRKMRKQGAPYVFPKMRPVIFLFAMFQQQLGCRGILAVGL